MIQSKKILLTTAVLLSAFILWADNFDDVANALKTGNAREVANYFNNNVALTILTEEGIYSKQQAEVMMRNFFAQRPPKNVTIQHRGASAQGARYAVAVYECAEGKYRAYIFMKNAGNGMLIHELRIEKD
jgi:hypothetical protein